MTDGGQMLPLARDLREALAVYARRAWPTNTTGYMAQAWGVSKDTAKNLLKGSGSDATVTQILRAGGWPLAISVLGATIGQGLEDFIDQERGRLARERSDVEARDRRLVAMAGHLRAGARLGGPRQLGLGGEPRRVVSDRGR